MSFATIRSWTQRVSIRLRLTLLFVLIFGASLVAFGVGTFSYLSQSLEQEFDDALFNYAVDVSESISLAPSGDLSLEAPQLDRRKVYPFSLGTALIQIRHRGGKILEQVGNFGDLHVPFHKDVDILSTGEEAAFRTLHILDGLPSKEAESYRVITLAVDNSNPPQLILQIAVPMTLLENQITNRKWALELGIPLILLISGILAYILSARALRPLGDIVAKAQKIEASNLSERLPLPPVFDEVRLLAETLNHMIDRLDRAFQSQERFVADASHQLLTPLTILKGELEGSLRHEGPMQASEVRSLLQEVDRLTKLVQDLLILARVDAGMGAPEFHPLVFEDLILEVVQKAQKIAKTKDIRVVFNIHNQESSSFQIPGVEDLLSHLVLNLVENAIKYSRAESTVTITLFQNPQSQLLVVEDQGDGVSDEDLCLIFERFHRGSSKSQQNRPGYGLGLAIAKRISRLHKGHLSVENIVNSEGYKIGARFSFELNNF